MRKDYEECLVKRTIQKLTKSQGLKKELFEHLSVHKPHLLQHSMKAKRIKECCNMITFRRSLETGEKELVNANFCKYDRVCIACATKRAIGMIKRFEQGIKARDLLKKYRYYIVLTIRHTNDDELEDLMDKLMDAKNQLARNYRNSRRPSQKKKSFFHQFDGMVMSIEISHKGKNGRHPHINILACSDNDIPIDIGRYWSINKKEPSKTNEELKAEWLGYTGDSYIHNIRKINVKKGHFTRNGIGEVFKYAIKFSDLEIDQLAEVMDLQHRKKYRFFSTYGIFRGWKTPKKKQKEGHRREGVYLFDEENMEYKIDSVHEGYTVSEDTKSLNDTFTHHDLLTSRHAILPTKTPSLSQQ